MWYIVGGLLIWSAVALPAAVVLGKVIRQADREQKAAREAQQRRLELVP